MTDEELEKMGFSDATNNQWEYANGGEWFVCEKDRLKAGAEGAKWILESLKRGYLKNDILNKVPIKNGKAAFVDSCLQEAIKNLKIFLGEEK